MRNYWREIGVSATDFNQIPITRTDFTIAAGETLKRFMFHGATFFAKDESEFTNSVAAPQLNILCSIVYDPFNFRYIYRSSRRIPSAAYALYNQGSGRPDYLTIWHAGDLELGFNQQTSYGSSTQQGFTFRVDLWANDAIGSAGAAQWHLAGNLAITGNVAP